MINFDFYTPTRVLFGADRENEAGKQEKKEDMLNHQDYWNVYIRA